MKLDALASGLLVAGTVAGTLGGAHLPAADWRLVTVGLVLLAAGAVLRRLVRRHGAVAGGSAPSSQSALAELRRLEARAAALADEARTLERAALSVRLDALESDYRLLAEAAPPLLRELGAARFARIFAAFASSERAVARAWSALADGHQEEAVTALGIAASRARQALESFEDRAPER